MEGRCGFLNARYQGLEQEVVVVDSGKRGVNTV